MNRWRTKSAGARDLVTKSLSTWNDWRTYPPRPAWVEVDTTAIKENTLRICQVARPASVMGVVKADGFGHGLVEAAHAVLSGGATHLGVAVPEEGIALRRAGISAPILVLGTIPPRLAEVTVENDLSVALCTWDLAEALGTAAAAVGRPARAHVKVDTGVHRIGLAPDETIQFIQALECLSNVRVEGIFSVLVDNIGTMTFVHRQHAIFTGLLHGLAKAGLRPPLAHLCNSAPLCSHPELALDIVRTARLLFGVTPWQPGLAAELGLRPALSIRCEVVFVKWVSAGDSIGFDQAIRAKRSTRLATLPVGFADVGRFLHGQKSFVLVHGRPAPVLEIASDQTLIDVTEILQTGVGDSAVLLGKQGDAEITIPQVMARTKLSGGTLCTGITRRLGKVYLRHNRPFRLQGYLDSNP